MTQSVFKVIVNGEHELAVDASEGTLLEALEAHKLEVNYHCKSGFCGACRSTLKSGSVRYLTDPLAYIRKGDILPCCCVPESDLEIDH
ncbi:class I ribonucleotide reductase maintenance protein YfaE [Idiomarina seosinensis]|uniref:(Fe-S)-binding protein n=1 Tax=Idiomarina seosinensis TaxID=281739 RepID=A0A432ZII1_9GAMM|nr:class I ribonucleotide reductase maintenance protein YfaE [Idiomarina seosinensis]RUO77640.1 (Fe-S)-binding protein [Idiomarina seosinensis]